MKTDALRQGEFILSPNQTGRFMREAKRTVSSSIGSSGGQSSTIQQSYSDSAFLSASIAGAVAAFMAE